MSDRAKFKPGDFSLGQVNDFFVGFGREGGNPTLLQRCNENKEMMGKLVRFLERGGRDALTERRAAISGIRIIGPDVAERLFDCKFKKKELEVHLSDIPFSKELLEKCAKTHFLIFVPAISILDMLKQQPKHAEQRPGTSLDEKAFASKVGTSSWILMRYGIVPGSKHKDSSEQNRLLQEGEMVPDVRETFYAAITYQLYTGRSLFGEYTMARCVNNDDSRSHFVLDSFPRLGINSGIWDLARQHDNLGLAACRKP